MEEKTISAGRKSAAFIGLSIIAFMAMFLISGVGVWAYSVAATFNSVEQVGMIFTLESVVRTVMIPISGKIGEKMGRKKLVVFAVALYIIAYAVAAVSQNFWMFTISRTITGFAWGLFVINLITLVSDIYGQDQGPKYAGILQALTTVGMIISGPVEGAICAVNWRLLFAISLPIMVVALIICIIAVPKVEPGKGDGSKMDIGGCVFTCVMLIPFSLSMNWGNIYGWGSPLIIALFVVTAVGLVLLLFAEKKAVSPMYPAKLLKNKYYLSIIVLSFAYSFVNGSQMYAPTFAQYVLEINSTLTGFLTLPGLIFATIITAVLGGIAAKTGKYKGMTWFWTILTLASGILLLFVKPMVGVGAMSAYVFLMVAQTPLGAANGVQQIVPYTYPMKVLKPEELAVGMSFMGLAGPLGINLANGICGGMMNGSGGLMSLFYIPIVMSVVMIIFTIFFKDVKQGDTI